MLKRHPLNSEVVKFFTDQKWSLHAVVGLQEPHITVLENEQVRQLLLDCKVSGGQFKAFQLCYTELRSGFDYHQAAQYGDTPKALDAYEALRLEKLYLHFMRKDAFIKHFKMLVAYPSLINSRVKAEDQIVSALQKMICIEDTYELSTEAAVACSLHPTVVEI